jgi:hypothetical protein
MLVFQKTKIILTNSIKAKKIKQQQTLSHSEKNGINYQVSSKIFSEN